VSTPRRSTPRKVAGGTTYQVLFTGFSDSKQESIVKQLGMKVNNVLILLAEGVNENVQTTDSCKRYTGCPQMITLISSGYDIVTMKLTE
jgi:hypothetical protein